MEKDVKTYSLYLIAIVAIVAVVGIVVMTTNYDGFGGTTSEDVLTSDEGEASESVGLAGQAYSIAGCTDPDASSSAVTISQFLNPSTVTNNKGIKPDKCVTEKSGITYLYEAICLYSGTSSYLKKNCAALNSQGKVYQCKDGACVDIDAKPTCTPGLLTETGKCWKDSMWNSIYYQQEYQNGDCTTSLKNTSFCGYNNDALCNNVGCCKDELVPNTAICQGNVLYNQTKNSCTGELKDNYIDCLKQASGWAPKTCKINSVGAPYCGTVDCKSGDITYTCTNNGMGGNYNYYKAICETFSWGGQWKLISEFFPTCPEGATCYNPDGNCAGPKTT
ncbi:hypothetical protein HY636_05535 [Candidatus Woesearchaeota archaeon]|nr:hypothetical protein [Candidatus Woesearchaeota archaeon]